MTVGALSSRERLLQTAIPLVSSLIALIVAVWYIASFWETQQHPHAASSPLHTASVYPVVAPERARAALLDALTTVGRVGWTATLVYVVRRFASRFRSR